MNLIGKEDYCFPKERHRVDEESTCHKGVNRHNLEEEKEFDILDRSDSAMTIESEKRLLLVQSQELMILYTLQAMPPSSPSLQKLTIF